jgi:hypothetical protein
MEFQSYQRAFTARIRDPQAKPRPRAAPAKRMRVYEELLYNNLEGFLLACFPVCRKILGVRRWRTLVRMFFRDHANHSPYFRQIPEEFLKYLQDEWTPGEGFPAFLPELAHYEWVELELDTSNRDRDLPPHDPDGDLLTGQPVLNPVMRVLAYRWPVHRLSPRHKLAVPPDEPTFLVAFRDAAWETHFNHINSASAVFLQLLQERPDLSGAAVIEKLAAQLGYPDVAALSPFGHQLLLRWRNEGLILGTRLTE